MTSYLSWRSSLAIIVTHTHNISSILKKLQKKKNLFVFHCPAYYSNYWLSFFLALFLTLRRWSQTWRDQKSQRFSRSVRQQETGEDDRCLSSLAEGPKEMEDETVHCQANQKACKNIRSRCKKKTSIKIIIIFLFCFPPQNQEYIFLILPKSSLVPNLFLNSFPLKSIFKYIFPICMKLCNDTVALVRKKAANAIYHLIDNLEKYEGGIYAEIVFENIKGFSNAQRYNQRQT